MRLCRVEVANLLGFRELDLQIHHEFQLIAGPNNAGKSSLVRLLEAFFSGNTSALGEMLPINQYYIDAGPRILSDLRLWFSGLTAEEAQHCNRALLSGTNRFWISARSSRTGSISYRASKKLSAEESEALYHYILTRFHFAKVPSVRVGGGL